MSVYSMGIYLGSGIAFLAGGVVVRFTSVQTAWLFDAVPVMPWRLILIEMGAAGLLFSLMIWTFREPERRGRSAGKSKVPLGDVRAFISLNRWTLICHHLGFSLCSLAGLAGAAWIPEMFRRRYEWSPAEFGIPFGIIVAVFGCLGAVVAGRIADAWLRRGVRDANLRVGAIAALLRIASNVPAFLSPSAEWSMAWLVAGAASIAAPFGVAAAALQQILPAGIRSQLTALNLLVANVVGAAGGPTLTAVLTQHVFRRDEAVNYSLVIVYVAALLAAAALLWIGRRPFMTSVNRLHRNGGNSSVRPS